MSNFPGFAKGTDITDLDAVAQTLKKPADDANKAVNDSIAALKDTPDNPALLADLQHSINKWSVIYNMSSTIVRSMKDLMQGILQKFP